MKIVINKSGTGLYLSHEAVMLYAQSSGTELYAYIEKRDINDRFFETDVYVPATPENIIGKEIFVRYVTEKADEEGKLPDKDNNGDWYANGIKREDPFLIKVVELLGEKANHDYSILLVVEIPDDVQWYVAKGNRMEWVAEKHRVWGKK